MSIKTILGAAALAAVAVSGAASATTITFDLRNVSGNSQLVSNSGNVAVFSAGGVTLTIGGFGFSGGINGTASVGDATAWDNGVGLRSPNSLDPNDAHFVDGYYDEYLTLSFSTAVDVTGASFSYADQGDDWQFYSGVLGSQMFEDSGMMAGSGVGSSVYSTSIDSAATGLSFLLGTTINGSTCTRYNWRGHCTQTATTFSEWKLRGLTVNLLPPPPPPPAPVPLPAAGWMLLAGLGGIAAVSRRRRKA